MPFQLALSDDSYRVIKLVFESRIGLMKQNISAHIERVIEYEKILEELNAASHFKEPKSPQAETIKKKAVAPQVIHNLCKEHVTYGAKRRPTRDCEACWAAFEKYNGRDATNRARRDYERKTGRSLKPDGKVTKSLR